MTSSSLRCWAEVDLDALRENLSWIRHRIGPAVKILAVVKADAYGHGLKPIAALLMQSGADLFGVANLAEARAIRAVGRGWPILMLGPCLPDETESAVRDDVRLTLSSAAEARRVSGVAARLRRTVSVHVKVDTGMGRLGVDEDDAQKLARLLTRLPGLRLEGIYTHFASAEDDAESSAAQTRRFRRVLAALEAGGLRPALVHASNSAALLHEPDAAFNLVRPGLLVYGIPPGGRRALPPRLARQFRPALAFKCRVGLVKSLPRGARVSYGGTFTASRPLRVAVLTAGYGDGYLRAGSHRAHVLLHGRRCPVLGRITMDQTIVDVTPLRRVQPGDEAVLLGRQGREAITAAELAGWCGTIPWEILTAITYRVPRIYRGSQAS
jgi:alanine racemase